MASTRRGNALLAVLVVAALSACSSGSDDAAASGTAATSSSSASAAPSGTPSTPAPTAVGPTPTPGPSVIAKLKRPGQPAKPSIEADRANFDAAVAYPDGVTLEVRAVEGGVETGHGAGVFAGREFTVFALVLHNGTKTAIDLQQVLVTATYGSKDLVAERVYADNVEAVDFGGSLAPGKDAEARYAFAVPAKALADVRLVVDFDGAHTSAVFRGDARKAG